MNGGGFETKHSSKQGYIWTHCVTFEPQTLTPRGDDSPGRGTRVSSAPPHRVDSFWSRVTPGDLSKTHHDERRLMGVENWSFQVWGHRYVQTLSVSKETEQFLFFQQVNMNLVSRLWSLINNLYSFNKVWKYQNGFSSGTYFITRYNVSANTCAIVEIILDRFSRRPAFIFPIG